MRRLLLLAAIATTCISSAARAADLQIVIDQIGPNVVATGTGSLPDLAGLTVLGSNFLTPMVNPVGPIIYLGSNANANYYFGPFTVSGSLGSTNKNTNGSSGVGPVFGYSSSLLILPLSYVAGTQLSSTATWTNQTFSALGLTPGGTTNITWNSGTRSMSVTVTPEPSTIVTGLIATAAGVFTVRRRSRA